MSFRPYVSRSKRIYRYCDAMLRWIIRDHPEKLIFGTVCGGIGTARFLYLYLNSNGFVGERPYYRGQYDIVRPDHRRALEWRVPEEYPARYLTNRETEGGLSFKRDYGFNQKLE